MLRIKAGGWPLALKSSAQPKMGNKFRISWAIMNEAHYREQSLSCNPLSDYANGKSEREREKEIQLQIWMETGKKGGIKYPFLQGFNGRERQPIGIDLLLFF